MCVCVSMCMCVRVSMCMCVCVSVHVCLCKYVHVCLCKHVHVFGNVHVCLCNVHVCLCKHVHVCLCMYCMCVCVSMCMCVCVCMCMCVCVSMCIYVCVCMCMCVCVSMCMCVCVCMCIYVCVILYEYVFVRVSSPHDAWFSHPEMVQCSRTHCFSQTVWDRGLITNSGVCIRLSSFRRLWYSSFSWIWGHAAIHIVFRNGNVFGHKALCMCRQISAFMTKCNTMSWCKPPKGMFCIQVKLRRFRLIPWFVKTTTTTVIHLQCKSKGKALQWSEH